MDYKPLQAAVYQRLKEAILSGDYSFDTFYSEAKVAQSMGVSRTPVRDAFQRLSQEHYVDIIPSKGFILHKPSAEDFRKACQTRSAVEIFCAKEMARQCQEPEAIAALKDMGECVRAQARLLVPQQIKDFWALDIRFHRIVVRFAKNDIFEDLFSSYMHYFISTSFPRYVEKKRDMSSLREHSRLIQAIESGRPAQAEKIITQHLQASLELTLFDS